MSLPERRIPVGWSSLFASAALLALVFAVDLQMPLGYAVWVIYLVPVGLTLFQPNAWLPFAMAALASVLTGVGYFASPSGLDPFMISINRGMGVICLWVLAFVIRQVLVTRGRLQLLLWLQEGRAALAQRLLGELTPQQVGANASAALCEFLGAHTAVLYQLEGRTLHRCGGHALDPDFAPERIEIDQGLTGQVARDGKARQVGNAAEGHLALSSALGRSLPRQLLVGPLRAEGEVCGVIELGFTRSGAHLGRELELLEHVAQTIGVALRSALYRERLEALLEETQRQSEELQVQQEEMLAANEELEQHNRLQRESQLRLEAQQAELEQTNVQLEEQGQALERQKQDLLRAQDTLRANTVKLETASRYKSEFLANMSHELRTPLNSSLILAKLLADNRGGNLDAEQVKYAQAIHASNNDLLTLINDILDLSRIEAGHVEIVPEPVGLRELVERLRPGFEPLARQKALAFTLEVLPDTDDAMHTDAQRLLQVLRNLLANAIKFTERGEVALRVAASAPGRLAFEVRDSGIGIAPEQQELIFEAFRQADGSTSRKYGGTGLGLSISRELAQRLGGQLRVSSEPGRGSVFTLDLPAVLAGGPPAPVPAARPLPVPARAVAPASAPAPMPAVAAIGELPTPAPLPPRVEDERHRRLRPDRLILAVEDDEHFARVLHQQANECGFDCVVASTAAEALRLARELRPSGILLDIGLPDHSGLGVLEQLKRDPATRHLPVHMISAHDQAQTARELGAIGHVLKPAAREEIVGAIERMQQRLQQPLRRLLVVEDDAALRENLCLLLKMEQVEISAVGSLAEALEQLAARSFDCVVLDLSLPDGSGYELLDRMAEGEKYAFPPVIVYTGRVLSADEEQRLRRYSRSIIVKGARSPERLLDEVTLFLHSVEAALPEQQQRLLRQARQRDAVLEGRRILLAEDDVRNIFAMSSVFEPLGAKLEIARNGREALERLDRANDIDLVLMDVMMPEMDGLTAMRRIREHPAWARLPVIALTAKAMPDDRERCLEAGASDYVAKPIDIDRLVSLCRVWMPR